MVSGPVNLPDFVLWLFVFVHCVSCFILVCPCPVKFPTCVIANPPLMCCTYLSCCHTSLLLPDNFLPSNESSQVSLCFLVSYCVYHPFFDHFYLPSTFDTFACLTACTDQDLFEPCLSFPQVSEFAL